jgi:hypothetical protein
MGLKAFATAAPQTKAGKDEKVIHRTDTTVSAAINGLVNTRKQIDELEAQYAGHEEVVKNAGTKITAQMFDEGKEFESFEMTSAENGILFIMQDRFSKLDATKAKAAKDLLGDDAVMESETYTIDPTMVEKHGDAIAKAIEAMDIPNDDKAKLLVCTTTWKYTFGLNEIGEVARKKDLKPAQVIQAVKPVTQVKMRSEKKAKTAK